MVRKYYRMSPSEYLRYTERASERGKVFEPFRDEILELYWLNRGDSIVVAKLHAFRTDPPRGLSNEARGLAW